MYIYIYIYIYIHINFMVVIRHHTDDCTGAYLAL